MRLDERAADALRPVSFERAYSKYAEGAVLAAFGDTKVLCTASVEDGVPPFLRETGTGWVTAEYAMLPRSSHSRIPRDRNLKGRALEISRLIGRSLRCVVDLAALGERQIILDCDVLQADGGTRTAAITGAYIALHEALRGLAHSGAISKLPVLGQCAAVSVGMVEGEARLDLCYEEDFAADVDFNVVMRSDGRLVEVQGSAEGEAFSREEMGRMMDLATAGIGELFALQRRVLDAG